MTWLPRRTREVLREASHLKRNLLRIRGRRSRNGGGEIGPNMLGEVVVASKMGERFLRGAALLVK